jgi:uncharacterized membrane protein YccF (DUF307 family)
MGAIARIIWFVLIGWWLGPLWFGLSLLLMATIILFPIGAYTATKTWQVMTFKTSPTVVVKEAQEKGD